MSAPQTIGSYRRATALSVALHALAIAALFALRPDLAPEPGTGERSESVRVARVTISARAPRAVVRARAARPVRIARASVAPALATLPGLATRSGPAVRAYHPARNVALPHGARALPRAAHATNVIAQTRVEPAVATAISARPTSAAAPAALPAATPIRLATEAPIVVNAASVTERDAENVSGNWGETERPLVADDGALASVRATVHASGALFADIAVDERGRASRVVLPATLADDVRADLEQRLLALRYVPAECNGLRCAGTLRVAL